MTRLFHEKKEQIGFKCHKQIWLVKHGYKDGMEFIFYY